ncbi:MAG: glycoside hydrolase family 92 protein [Prevotella sp.]|nr:glycoside hydrolase family 92 protein [Prevotella sp.]
MAEQGSWMPIFPCWNSYTAAMIGDHCASVLADAYVKGIEITRPSPQPLPVRAGSDNSILPDSSDSGQSAPSLQDKVNRQLSVDDESLGCSSRFVQNQAEPELKQESLRAKVDRAGSDNSILPDSSDSGHSTPLTNREGQGGGSSSSFYSTAYHYLRQNAFESPSPEQYKNGMGRRALDSYLKYGYIPMEDHVLDAFHTDEQTSRTLEYAYDDFCVAQLARDFGTEADYQELMRRSENWRNVINPRVGWADGRHTPSAKNKKGGEWENNQDLVHRKSYITEGATCHYSWYVPQNIPALVEVMGGTKRFEEKLDSMFEQGLYWHGNEPCHQIAYLFNYAGRPDLTKRWVRHILDTEYNDTPGGLSGNDDAGQMSAWYVFSSIGFYPVCPGTPNYELAAPTFQRVVLNLENGKQFTIEKRASNTSDGGQILLDGQPLRGTTITHSDILKGATLQY